MTTLFSLEQAERFVSGARASGLNIQWDGWDIVFFRPGRQGSTHPRGVRRGKDWGFETRFPLMPDGTWSVDPSIFKNLKWGFDVVGA